MAYGQPGPTNGGLDKVYLVTPSPGCYLLTQADALFNGTDIVSWLEISRLNSILLFFTSVDETLLVRLVFVVVKVNCIIVHGSKPV